MKTNAVEADSLKRVFGLPTLVIYGVGDILGAGIYAVVGKSAGLSGTLVWASFLTAMIVAAFTALSYAELGSRFPQSGGVACFVHRAFRTDWLSILVGWLMFCTCLVSMATLSKAFAGYLNAFVPTIPAWLIILTLFSVLAFVNFRGMKESSALNIFCTSVKVCGLLIVILVSTLFLSGDGAANPAAVPNEQAIGWSAMVQGAALAFYAFIGFEDIVNVAEEVKNPERNVPRAILLALAIAGVVYILVSWLAIQVLNPSELAASGAPLLEVFRIAAPCAASNCQHFDGKDCRLAQRIVEKLPVVVEELPPCSIRRDCRWWQQEGKIACMRCPQVITDNYNPSELMREVAKPASI